MKLIYVAGKYTAETKDQVKRNIQHAEEAAKNVLLAGDIPVIPHKITSFFDLDPRLKEWSKDAWLIRFCYPLLARCDAILMLKGWEQSVGAKAEFIYATEHEIPVLYEDGAAAGKVEELSIKVVSVGDAGTAKDK